MTFCMYDFQTRGLNSSSLSSYNADEILSRRHPSTEFLLQHLRISISKVIDDRAETRLHAAQCQNLQLVELGPQAVTHGYSIMRHYLKSLQSGNRGRNVIQPTMGKN